MINKQNLNNIFIITNLLLVILILILILFNNNIRKINKMNQKTVYHINKMIDSINTENKKMISLYESLSKKMEYNNNKIIKIDKDINDSKNKIIDLYKKYDYYKLKYENVINELKRIENGNYNKDDDELIKSLKEKIKRYNAY